ncbi:hypothetical protein [Azohydromonas lata]|uniref:hypothetical protein n=1 Tax=Azohydromonas lata TaxID=45677 RepID=UPI0012F4A329|nr:hypothetical protein [Azohydromonas lata]
MSAADHFKFDPGLFADGPAREATDSMPTGTVVRLRRWPVAALLVGIIAVSVVVVKANIPERKGQQDLAEASTVNYPGQPVATKFVSESRDVPVSIAPPSSSWCEDSDALCTKLTTSKPAEALRKIISTIPQGMAKQYRVQVSITPIEDALSE